MWHRGALPCVVAARSADPGGGARYAHRVEWLRQVRAARGSLAGTAYGTGPFRFRIGKGFVYATPSGPVVRFPWSRVATRGPRCTPATYWSRRDSP